MEQQKLSAAIQRVTSQRSQLILNEPFFGVLSLKLKVRERKDIGTACTDGVNMDFNPAFVEKQSDMQLQGLIAHEVMHNVLHHMTRRQQRLHGKWNVACDHAINPMLLDSGFILPEGGLCDYQYKGMSAEQIYELLPDEAGDTPCPWGQVHDAPTQLDETTGAGDIDVDWDLAVQQAAQIAKAAGKLPGSMERLIDHLEKSRIDFRQYLWPFFTGNNKDDFSWRKPNRAYISEDEYFPSMYNESPGTYVVGMDTSGSTANQIHKFLSEIVAIHQDVRPERLVFIQCDTQVDETRIVDVTADEELSMEILNVGGGGGTLFQPVFDWVKDNYIEPEGMIFFTDLCPSDEYPPEPAYPVLWVSTEADAEAPFGKTTYLLH